MITKKLHFPLFGTAIILLWPLSLYAQNTQSERHRINIEKIIDNVNIEISDGEIIHLAGLADDKSPGQDKQACHEIEKNFLQKQLISQTIEMQPLHTLDPDWTGKIPVWLYGQKNELIQLSLVREGYARAYSFADGRDYASDLLAAETEARKKQKGLWNPMSGCYRITSATDLSKNPGDDGFLIVEGHITKIAETSSGLYLDFGTDWRHDFSAMIDFSTLPLFSDIGLYPKEWRGADIRLRGWVFTRMGPMIRIDHPEQIELLSLPPDEGPKTAKEIE